MKTFKLRKVSLSMLLMSALFSIMALGACSSSDDYIDNGAQPPVTPSQPGNTNDSTKTDSDTTRTDTSTVGSNDSILIVYFSRPGYNYNGSTTNLKYTNPGNTAVMAGYILQYTGGRTFEILPANPYPDDYMETVRINMEEERNNARPAILNPLNVNLAHYRYIFVGSPVWNSQAPMIMHTFYDTYRSQLQGKVMIPFGTHEMSGISGLVSTMRRDLGENSNTYLEGLGLIGRTINSDDSRQQAYAWLARIGFTRR